jgi:hypothetical protein
MGDATRGVTLADLYYKNLGQRVNCEAFMRGVVEHYAPHLTFYQPQPMIAPWHVQCRLPVSGEVVNFWPHKLKVHREGEATYEGIAEIHKAIQRALEDPSYNFEVIDDDDRE